MENYHVHSIENKKNNGRISIVGGGDPINVKRMNDKILVSSR